MPGDWARLGKLVNAERGRRRQKQGEFARLLGISVRTLGSIERGETDRYDAITIASIEDALSWERGSVERVVRGSDPITADPNLTEIQALWPELSAGARSMLARLARELADGD